MLVLSCADYSQAYLGRGGDLQAWQYVLGYRIEPAHNVWTGLEYAYSKNIWGSGPGAEGIFYPPSMSGGANFKNNTLTLDITAMF